MISQVNWIRTEISDYPKYYVVEPVEIFLNKVDSEIREDKKTPFLDIALIETPTRWWRIYMGNIIN